MPLIKTSKGWKFGKSGKVYTGVGARKKARKQGAAISISKKRRKK